MSFSVNFLLLLTEIIGKNEKLRFRVEPLLAKRADMLGSRPFSRAIWALMALECINIFKILATQARKVVHCPARYGTAPMPAILPSLAPVKGGASDITAEASYFLG